VIVAGVAYGVGFIFNRDPVKHLLTAAAIAVAAIPEGLPAIMSMTMVSLLRQGAHSETMVIKVRGGKGGVECITPNIDLQCCRR